MFHVEHSPIQLRPAGLGAFLHLGKGGRVQQTQGQAVGNVGAALYKGAPVYLRPENPLFAFYRELGLHLRSTDELAAERRLVAITPDERRDNRERIGATYARERVLQAIRTLPALQR